MARSRDIRPREPAVDYDQFLTIVEQQADLGRDAAEQATRAVLQTLAERIAQGEARDLADELPAELAPWRFTDGDAETFHADEFLRRVADREDVDVATAPRHVRAVFTAIARAMSEDEYHDMVAELPRDFDPASRGTGGRGAHDRGVSPGGRRPRWPGPPGRAARH
jgi:uncharacterized protein (DUF2267 family)